MKVLFRVLCKNREVDNFNSYMSKKMAVVIGGISLENLGIINANVRKELLEE